MVDKMNTAKQNKVCSDWCCQFATKWREEHDKQNKK